MMEINKIKQLNDVVEKIIIFDDVAQAKKTAEVISHFLIRNNYSQNYPDIHQEYFSLATKLRWVALPILARDDMLGLFKYSIQEIFKIEGFDLNDKFRKAMISVPIEERDGIKMEIRNALNKNQTRLTSKKISGDADPTINNWLRAYISYVGNSPADSVKIRQFYSENKDFSALKLDEQEKVRVILGFYEKIKLSSLTVGGIEDVVPVSTEQFKGYIRNGLFEKEDGKVDQRTQKLFDIVADVLGKKSGKDKEELQAMAGQFPEGSLERKAIEEEINKLK